MTVRPDNQQAGKRFAFAGRCSTEDNQDPESSRAWQLARAEALIKPHGGEVVAEFFDKGQSRSLPWKRRPRSADLLVAMRDPERGFDAVVIGEPHRMFYGNQFGLIFPLFVHFGVELWVPEVGGAVDPGSDAHDMVMSLYGGMSKGERNRIKIRVRAAMAAQAATEGRFLGGRPPYGYMLGDAGPHPNPSKAADGARLHRLVPDPVAAPVVGRIFSEYVAGKGVLAIAEGLTADGIPSPSAHDPERNKHRQGNGGAWAKTAVRAILDNPRYTGRQVWNKQRRDEVLMDIEDVAMGYETKMRWNDKGDWVWSAEKTHEALVSDELFDQAAQLRAAAGKRFAVVRPRRKNVYCLSSRLFCACCARRMQGAWLHDEPYYRCVTPKEYGAAKQRHPKSVNVREKLIVPELDKWLAESFSDRHIEDTVELMAQSVNLENQDHARIAAARETIKSCDDRLDKYRKALDAGVDEATIGKWIADVLAERAVAERVLGNAAPERVLTKKEIRAMVAALKDIVRALNGYLTPEERTDIYDEVGLSLTYHESGLIEVEARPAYSQERVGGGT
ncbi:MAG: site-specific recombinase [Acidimicrobiaceae bacterium]|nr:site-specific recombinase [Acidimicrobiaceae bacterium]